jgi:hypothetical protein
MVVMEETWLIATNTAENTKFKAKAITLIL